MSTDDLVLKKSCAWVDLKATRSIDFEVVPGGSAMNAATVWRDETSGFRGCLGLIRGASVCVRAADGSLGAALVAALEAALVPVASQPHESAVLVTDDPARDESLSRRATIEVARPDPFAAASALDNILSRRTHGALLADDPDGIVSSLIGLHSHGVVFPARLIVLAREVPRVQLSRLPGGVRWFV